MNEYVLASFHGQPEVSPVPAVVVREEVIDDTQYFNMIDNQVRARFADFEVKYCLPAAQMLYARAEIPDLAMVDVPTEGYYYKSPELKELFKRIRNLQTNKEVYKRVQTKKNEPLDFLKSVYESDLMGITPTEWYPWPDAPMIRRYDIMTITMQDKDAFNELSPQPWTIDGIVNVVGKHYQERVNLVELAYLANDPRCLCCGCESNSLSRMYAILTGSYSLSSSYFETKYIWKVSPEMQALGEKIVKAYNEIIRNPWAYLGDKKARELDYPSLDNHYNLKKTFETPRVAHLGYLLETKWNYFWILDDGLTLSDVYTPNFITSENFYDNRGPILAAARSPERLWYNANAPVVNLSDEIYKPSWKQ